MSAYIGTCAIDIGFYSTKVCIADPGEHPKALVFPSMAARLHTGAKRFGQDRSASIDGFSVRVGQETFFVGKDVTAYLSGVDPRIVTSEFPRTTAYKALFLGALNHARNATGITDREMIIERLVLGLPVSNFANQKEHVRALARGKHVIGADEHGAITVDVKNVYVMMQPEGAIWGIVNTTPDIYDNYQILVIDVGGGTLDWFVNYADLAVESRSDSHTTAMLACAAAVADRIKSSWRNNFNIMGRIDQALRDGRASLVVGGENYDMEDYKDAVESVIEEGLTKMMSSVQSLDDIDYIYFCGGGARLFSEHFKRMHSEKAHLVHVDPQPIFSNVIGFYFAGENQREINSMQKAA